MSNNWRYDSRLSRSVFYKKRFALRPKICSDGTRVWFKTYFDKFETWNYSEFSDELDNFGHTDFIESITEEEYIVRRLAETL